ncbi:MAG: GbsR/MarR family transcriptional regulator [Halanaerobiaceae bacterium]
MADDELMEGRNIIIESLGQSVGVYGMNETIGRIYGYLFFKDGPVPLDEIAEDLGVSKATVSINIRLLLELKMVKKVWKRGSRKDFYEAERDFIKIVREVLSSKEREQVHLIQQALGKAREKYQQLEENGTVDFDLVVRDLEKLDKMQEFVDKHERVIDLFVNILSHDKVEEELQEIDVDWRNE